MAGNRRHASVATNVDGAEHYRKRFETQRRRTAILAGCLVGLVAGLLWEAIRR